MQKKTRVKKDAAPPNGNPAADTSELAPDRLMRRETLSHATGTEFANYKQELATVNDQQQNRNLELSQSNNDLVNLLSSVQMAIVMLGRDLRIRRFTPTAEKMLNLISTDVGRPIGDIKLGLTVSDLEPMAIEVIDTVSVKEQLVQDKHGHWFSLRMHPYKTLENQIDGAVLVLVDVHLLKRAESALSESENRFSQLADAAPVLIWVSGIDGSRHVNKAYLEFLGVSEEQIQGFEWMRFIHPDDRQAYVDAYNNALARREAFERQFRFRRADGVYRWMKTAATPRMSGGEFVGFVGYKVDITDLKDAERTLHEADRSKNNFLAVLAHELRTPLAAIRNAVQVIGHERGTAELTARAKAVIDRQTVQMVRMVDDLLDLTRLTRGTLQLRRERIDMLDALRQAIDATAHERDANAQTLKLDLPAHPIYLEADSARLQQVFANLLGNAARYTPRQGHVWVSVTAEPAHAGVSGKAQLAHAYACVRVRDDGIGIDPQMLPHVFNLFSQFEAQGMGLGIGLNLASRMVEMHGGDISAFSAGRDQGSEFIVRLPIEVASRQIVASADNRATAAPGVPMRVLVVEDNADAADMLVNLLQLARQKVHIANDGESALRAAQEFLPQVALVDISMPEMDGREVARRLRADPLTANAYIVAVTGFSPNEIVLDISSNGFDERVTKPLENSELLALLARATQKAERASD